MFWGGQVGATVWMWYNQDVFCIIRLLDLQFIPLHPAAPCGIVNGDLSLFYTRFLLILPTSALSPFIYLCTIASRPASVRKVRPTLPPVPGYSVAFDNVADLVGKPPTGG